VEPEGFDKVVVVGRQRYSPDPAQLQGYLRVRASLENGPEGAAVAVARLELHTIDEVTPAVMRVIQPGCDVLSEHSGRGQAQRTGVQIGQAVPECGREKHVAQRGQRLVVGDLAMSVWSGPVTPGPSQVGQIPVNVVTPDARRRLRWGGLG